MPQTDAQEVLRNYLIKHGLKASKQREVIVDVFLQAGGHLRVDELLEKARQVDGKISQATVYRTMKLLTECGLASARNFLDGQTRYESKEDGDTHHDHLICTQCGRIIEFVDPRIEDLQDKIAKKYHFTLQDHKMELYGICRACR